MQLPALVIGVPQDVATPYVLGTNKISSFAGTLMASWVYLRKLSVQAVMLAPLIVGAITGSAIGATISRHLPRELLTPVVLVAVVAVGIYTFRRPSLGLEHQPLHRGAGTAVRAALIGAAVGLYDGLLGPGTGSFFVLALVGVMGYGFLQASVNAKLANVATNVAAIVVYGIHGELLLALGVIMAVANVAGGLVGARMALARGNRFIRRVFLLVISLLAVKLGWDTLVMFT